MVGADLRGTILTGARLEDALCDWRWSAIPAELLRQCQGPSAEGSRLVVALAFHDDPGPWSWLKLFAGFDRLADWALGVLAGWVRDGDNAPDLLRYLAADVMNGRDRRVEVRKVPVRRIEELAGQDRERTGLALHPSMPADPPATPRMMWTRRE